MSIARIKNWQAGEVLTANDLENEFNNLANNVLAEPIVLSQQLDANGQLILLDADGDTLLDASVNNTVDITIGGADDFRLTANTFTALSGSSITLDAGALTVTDGQTTLADPDSRTNTVATPLIVAAETSGTPAAGIGTGILFKAESGDEAPSSFGQVDFSASDVGAGTEDTYFRVWLRVAGAALTECWRWAATGAFKGIFTHANSADRTYTLRNFSYTIGAGEMYNGPASAGSGSTRSIETFTSATGNLSGIHFYSGNFTLDSGHTLTVPAGSGRVIICATGTITIAGTITGSGGGFYAGGAINTAGSVGTDQPGGASGNGNSGGSVVWNGFTIQAGGSGAGTQVTGSSVVGMSNPFLCFGGASGAGSDSVTGGRGGASIVLIAPIVVLNATAVLNTSGSAGSNAAPFGNAAGGGGAGNVYIETSSYTDNGCTFTLTGGAGGSVDSGLNGYAGATGVKQINIYS